MSPNSGVPSMESLVTPTENHQLVTPWQEYEHRACLAVIAEVRREEDCQTDTQKAQLQNQGLWDRVSHGLQSRGVFRNPSACRDYWTKIGRNKSGIDERLNHVQSTKASSSKTKRSARRKAVKEDDPTVATASSSPETLLSAGGTSRETSEAGVTYRWQSTAEQEEKSDGSVEGIIIHDGVGKGVGNCLVGINSSPSGVDASQNIAVELEDIAASRLPTAESADLRAPKRKLTRVQYYPKKKSAPLGTRRKAVRFEEDEAASKDEQADANVIVTQTHDLRRSTRGVLESQNRGGIVEEISLRQSTRLRVLPQVKYFESDPEEEVIDETEDGCTQNAKRPTTVGKKEDPFEERKYKYPKFWFHRRDGHGDRELRILQDAEYGQRHPNKKGAHWWTLAFAKDPAKACKVFNDQLQLSPEQKDWSYNWDEIANSWDQTGFKERVTLHFDVNHLGEPLRAWVDLWQEDEKEPTRVKLGLVNKYFVYSLRHGVHSLHPPLPSKWPVIQTGKKSGGPILKLTGIDGNTLDNLYRWKKIDNIIVTIPQGEECPEEVASRWFNVEYLAELDNKRRRRKVFCRCVATVRPDSPWERMVKCKRCGTRQHLECYGYDPDEPPPKRYRCEWCKKDAEIEVTVDTIISKLRSCSSEQLQAIKRGKEVGFNHSPGVILNSAVDLPPISIHRQKSGCHLSLL